jgi:RNA polymerase sigma-70 factor, ECF subfamily
MYAAEKTARHVPVQASRDVDTETQIIELLPALRSFSRHFEKNSSDAEDLVQETLMRALRSVHQFEAGSNLKSWLFTIMRNTYCNIYKKKCREPVGKSECVSSWMTNCSPTQEWSVMGQDLKDALDELSPERREVLLLIALGTSYDEAAAICGCAVGTIKSRVNRARYDLINVLGASDVSEYIN